MEKKQIVSVTFINSGILICTSLIAFVILPRQIQQSLSLIIYAMALLAGAIIGTLASKIYQLKQKLHQRKLDIERKQENFQQYIANVVHDLRSPVAAINMISELLESELTEVEPGHRDLLSSVRKSSSAMLNRICCILDNAKLLADKNYETLQNGSPLQLIKEVVEKHHILAIEKNIHIELHEEELQSEVLFERDGLESIFSNLISNAIKYSLPNTTITIAAQNNPDEISFLVKDEGLGMSPDDLKKVFGQYAKLSARPTGGEDSSGLGLYLVKSMAEKMQGTVKALSEGKGKGSTFIVNLKKASKLQRISA
ncbi:sensor histidine kinase [Roseimarinus sediminis]|uniref:sensor histidine kinase n=1 Tax=Roseimarinus sediminis TaxID=1610899 RepID=UPI003D1A56D3